MASPVRVSRPSAFEPFSPDTDRSDDATPPDGTETIPSAVWEVEDFADAVTLRPGHGSGGAAWARSGTEDAESGLAAASMVGGGTAEVAALRARVAAEHVAAHRAEIAAAERAARDAGYREGAAHAAQLAREELAPVRDALLSALASLAEHEQRFLGNLQENAVALALAVARMVVDREVATDVAVVEDLVRRALTEFPLDQPVRIRLHPADLATLMSLDPGRGEAGSTDPRRELSWLPDPLIARGGAMLEGRERIVDGRVDTALERVFRRLCNVT